MERGSGAAHALKARFAAALVEHGDWRQAAEDTGVSLADARRWMPELARLFRSPVVGASPVGAPAYDGALVGRGDELTAILDAYEQDGMRCVSLCGAPGVGKTRLAVEAARHMHGKREQVVFVCLDGARTQDEVVQRVAGAFSLQEAEIGPTQGDLVAYLRSGAARPGLLLVDAADDARGCIGGLVRAWLGASDRLEVLVTSRGRLANLDGAERWVAPLACPRVLGHEAGKVQLQHGAARLFVEHARRWLPERDLETRGAEIAAIVTMLDGMPAAICRAAQTLERIDLDAVVAGLQRPLELLDAHPQEGEPTMRERVQWSWARLDPSEQVLVVVGGVFAGAFTVAAATMVTAQDPRHVRAALHRAVEVGLALSSYTDGATRFRLLGVARNLVREHAASLGGVGESSQRHADHYAQRASAWLGDAGRLSADQQREISACVPDMQAACSRVRAGLVDPNTAVPIVRALAGCATGVPRPVVRDMLESVLSRRDGLEEQLLPGVLVAYGEVLRVQGHLSRATRQLVAARRLARSTTCSSACSAASVEALIALARIHFSKRRDSRAKWLGERSLVEARALAVSYLEIDAMMFLGDVERVGPDLPRAAAIFREALDMCIEQALPGLESQLRNFIGCIAWFTFDAFAAEDEWRASLRIHSERGDQIGVAKVTHNLTMADIAAGRVGQAYAAAARVYPFACSFGDPLVAYSISSSLAVLLHEKRGLDEALAYADRAVSVLDGTELLYPRMLAVAARGAYRADSGRIADARADLAIAQSAADTLGVNRPQLSLTAAHIELAEAKDAQRRFSPPTARAARARADEIADRLSHPKQLPGIAGELRLLHTALSNADEPALRVTVTMHAEGAWFQLPHTTPTDLSRRPVLSQIMRLLLDRRIACPGEAVYAADLFDAAWPQEKSSSESSLRNRLHVAVARLRKLGLESALLSGDGGYHLSTDIDFDVRQPQPG